MARFSGELLLSQIECPLLLASGTDELEIPWKLDNSRAGYHGQGLVQEEGRAQHLHILFSQAAKRGQGPT